MISQNQFITVNVEASQKGMSLAELAMVMGVSYHTLIQQRKKYKDMGVALPDLCDGRGIKPKDKFTVEQGQKIVAELMGISLDEAKAQGAELVRAAIENGKSLVRKEDCKQENKTIYIGQ